MDHPSANLPVWAQTDLSRPIQSHYVAHQAHEPHGIQAPPDLVLETQSQGSHFTAGQGYLPHPVDPHSALTSILYIMQGILKMLPKLCPRFAWVLPPPTKEEGSDSAS